MEFTDLDFQLIERSSHLSGSVVRFDWYGEAVVLLFHPATFPPPGIQIVVGSLDLDANDKLLEFATKHRKDFLDLIEEDFGDEPGLEDWD